MANKEATIYIVDVGRNTGDTHSGRDESDLEWSLRWVWDKITTTVGTGRKTAMVGVLGLRTAATDHFLSDEGGYEHISIFHPISVLMPDVRKLREKFEPSSTNAGDAISAIILATQMITDHCKKLKYTKKIFLVTNGRGHMDADAGDIAGLAKKIQDEDIELTVLGVDFDDVEYGFKEEDKSDTKASNETILRSLTEQCNGQFGTLEEAISALGAPRVKTTRPVHSYKGPLTLGDPENYDTAMSIDVERYPRIAVAKPPSASQFVVRSGATQDSVQSSETLQEGGASDQRPDGDLAAVKNARNYQVPDEDAPGGKKDVPEDELAKGYEYGRTAVHINESERNVTELDVEPCLDIIGFVPRTNVQRYFSMSKTCMIIAQKANDKASLALSSLIHALHELDTYAIARFVNARKSKPVILLLAPEIEIEYECLIDVELPFSEDIRQYRFPPLDRVLTVSGKTITEHRNLPSKDLMQAMSDYVDAMDLSTAGKDDDGDVCEYATMDQTFSPVLHNVNQNIQWRAARGDQSLAPVLEILTRYSRPPDDLVTSATTEINTLVKRSDVKPVPPKLKGRKRNRETEKPLSGLNVEELLGREKRTKISAENAIPEFKQYIENSEDFSAIKNAADQMFNHVSSYIQHSIGDSKYGMATEVLYVVKQSMIDYEEPEIYNEHLAALKRKVLDGSLGGNRTDMWVRIRHNRLGPITKEQSKHSKYSEEEAKRFMRVSPK
ncbi:ATP-dependent DNA helicase II subunit 2 [Pseudovirgaria hyperparasitica]|uniref:ATP-dependent DNA helicase II subunit 2 n=1 Tax=Pseudovirgaria hyperparasitica TaxID=470096 RepID=A0A6A6W580_9PEZI|nr:ATP-dependent DNA helicase II subunit 2 [Pseudovirgaria hyperparasitica]KAF2758088.1 ATP-dependent DNA helicase II subunit 2 [Pseudovirgaria hyperparasitica]